MSADNETPIGSLCISEAKDRNAAKAFTEQGGGRKNHCEGTGQANLNNRSRT